MRFTFRDEQSAVHHLLQIPLKNDPAVENHDFGGVVGQDQLQIICRDPTPLLPTTKHRCLSSYAAGF
jgi:hypothetical protein